MEDINMTTQSFFCYDNFYCFLMMIKMFLCSSFFQRGKRRELDLKIETHVTYVYVKQTNNDI